MISLATLLVVICLIGLSFYLGYEYNHIIERNKKHNTVKKCKDQIAELQKNKQIGDEFKNFPKYYINLDRSKERRAIFEKHMEQYGVNQYQRVKAFDGKKIQDTSQGTIDGWKYYSGDRLCTKAELAITMSHLLAMKKASEDGHEVAMIMEDDCELTLVPHWPKKIDQIVSELPEDCEIFLMCNRSFQKVNNLKLEKVTNQKDFTGVCYLITRKGMERLQKFLIQDTDQGNFSFNLDMENIILDLGLMSEFKVYSYNISLFLLENYTSLSHHKPPDINWETVEILKNKPFLVKT
mgnify:CR=1 FL=1